MSEPTRLTDGERMIWAAAFGAFINEHWRSGPIDANAATRCATIAVWNARHVAENADGLSHEVGEDGLAMLRDMLGARVPDGVPVPVRPWTVEEWGHGKELRIGLNGVYEAAYVDGSDATYQLECTLNSLVRRVAEGEGDACKGEAE